MLFTKIVYTNTKGEEKERLVNVDYIISLGEKTQEPIELFDANGNLVETKEPTEKLFFIRIQDHCELVVKQDQYDELVKLLTK